MTFEDLDAWRKARLLVKAIYALIGDAGSLVSGLIASTRRRLAGKIAGSAALIVLVGWCGFRFLS
jgi:hypothetical protein